MRDHNTVTLSGVLASPPEPFNDTTLRCCSFVLTTRTEWRKTNGDFAERFDEIPVRSHGPVSTRVLRLVPGCGILVTAELRIDTVGRIYLNAKTIQLLTNINDND